MSLPPPYGTAFIAQISRPYRATWSHRSWAWEPEDPAEAQRISRGLKPPPWDGAIEASCGAGWGRSSKIVLLFEAGVLTMRFLASFSRVGLDYVCLDPSQLIGRGFISADPRGRRANTLRLGNISVRLNDVAAVVWCPPPAYLGHRWPSPNSRDNYLLFHRWRQFFIDLHRMIRPDALWLPASPLAGSPEWQNKFSDLAAAHRLGLAVPDTLVTNDAAEARQFVRRHRGGVIFREFSRAVASFAFKTGFVSLEKIAARKVARSPITLQQYVEKAFEVRAVIIGDRVFGCRVDSQASLRTKVDWRAYAFETVAWRRFRLPRTVTSKLVRLAQDAGLSWGSADLIRSRGGRYYFLELNRPGAQYWLLPFTGLDVTREIAIYIKRYFKKLP